MQQLEIPEQTQLTIVSDEQSINSMILNPEIMNQMQNLASIMSTGKSTVPKHLQGSTGDCMAIVMQSAQWQMNPFAVAQKTYLVNGVLGYEAQLVNAVVSSSNAIIGRFHYEYFGEWKSDTDPKSYIRVGAILRGEEEITWGEPLYPATVKTKNSPLWKTAPKQQAAYLAVKYWARMYCPAVILGVYSPEEFENKPASEKEINPIDSNGENKTRTQIVKERAMKYRDKPDPEPAQKTELIVNDLIRLIESAENNDALNSLKVHAEKLTEGDKELIRPAWTKKSKELKKIELNEWKNNIEECGDINTLNESLDIAPAWVNKELADFIGEKLDSLAS